MSVTTWIAESVTVVLLVGVTGVFIMIMIGLREWLKP
jgi:hypothetical protein